MAKRKELIDHAGAALVREMRDRGFDYLGDLAFARVVGDGVHQIISGGIRHGANLTFSVTCIVPEYGDSVMEDYPVVPLTCGGGLGDEYFSATLWDVGDDDEYDLNAIYSEVLSLIDRYALPWFDRINNRKAYVSVMFEHLREKAVSEGRLEAILHGTSRTLAN